MKIFGVKRFRNFSYYHLMVVNDSKKVPKSSKKYECVCCDYVTSRKSQFDRHLLTEKHKKQENDSKMVVNGSEKVPKSSNFTCECGKVYKFDSGYYRHKKTCNSLDNNNSDMNNKELVLYLMKENTELKQMMMETQTQVVELIKKGTNNTNSHNKTFNLQFFLNDTCKNAMNIMDFVNSLQLQMGDLEKMSDAGYVNGMSNIIIKNLKDMDITERPVHCTDPKREVLYVKDEDKWDKETQEKPKIRKAIKYIARKNARLLQEFKKNHPDCINSESKYSDTYNKMMIEAMGGKGNDDELKEKKIIKNISQEIIVDK